MFQESATSSDALIVLKLYKLRTEAVMRRARAWVLVEFWPETADEFFSVYMDMNQEQNHWLRQVVSYWEMAAAMVLRGALDGGLYVDCHNEPFFLLAKLTPILPAIQAKMPDYLAHTQRLVLSLPEAQERFTLMQARAQVRLAARKAS